MDLVHDWYKTDAKFSIIQLFEIIYDLEYVIPHGKWIRSSDILEIVW
jgi:hypothetical protein